jgi:hypothetical protein
MEISLVSVPVPDPNEAFKFYTVMNTDTRRLFHERAGVFVV